MINFLSQRCRPLKGQIRVPSDKSISHRALMLGAIADGQTRIHNLLMGADNLSTLSALQQLGIIFNFENENQLIVHGAGLKGLTAPPQILDLGNAGTGIRLMTGLLAGQTFNSELTGDESLRKRPMKRIVEPLRLMGAHIETSEQGTPPLKIEGGKKLTAINYSLPVASAQVKSGILLAGLYADGETVIHEPEISRDHTEKMLQSFGIKIETINKKISLRGNQHLKACDIKIPADISSAAFFMVAATIIPGSEILLTEVGINPTRTGIITILQKMGAHIHLMNQRMLGAEPVADLLIQSASLKGIEISAEFVPLAIDEFPIIFIAAACAQGQTVLQGAKELRVKESDRIAAMAEGFAQIGIRTEVFPDGICIHGGKMQSGTVDSHGDHRIAMAFAIAGALTEGIQIKNCDNVATSFPGFTEMAQQLGLSVRETAYA